MGITNRPAEDVWAEIQQTSRQLMRSGTPVETIVMGVKNRITAVLPDRIERRSEVPRGRPGGPGAPAHRSEIAAIWRQMNATGRSTRGLRFALALVALIEGVGIEAATHALLMRRELADSSLARDGRYLTRGSEKRSRTLSKDAHEDSK
jgi:hypothetical protein